MKKIVIMCSILLILFGCKAKNDLEIVDNFINKVNKMKEYELKGDLTIYDNEDKFNYDIKVNYLNNFYLVEMENISNNHIQIILKNNEGLYVITPALNKSFKFDSNWPNNSSQSYILSALVNDIKNGSANINSDKDQYIIETKVNYPNNNNLSYEKIFLDLNGNLKKVNVYDEDDNLKIEMIINHLDNKTSLKEEDFNLEKYVTNEACEDENCPKDTSVSIIENAIYPLFVPINTYLSSSEIVNDEISSRAIITFSGAKNYVLIEENAVLSPEPTILPVYGEPIMLNDTIAAFTSNSLNWTSGGINYYLASEDLTPSEMVNIAQSLTNAQNVAYTK